MNESYAASDRVFRCGGPIEKVKEWLAKYGTEHLRIATYGVSSFASIGRYIPLGTSVDLLVGISGIDPRYIADLRGTTASDRWHRLLERLPAEPQHHLLQILRKLNGWSNRGARVRMG